MSNVDLEKKLFKLPGGEEFKSTVDSLNVAQLEARISDMQKHLNESEEHKENNEDLKNAKEEVKLLSEPYNDLKNAIKIKTKYIIELIKEKGGK
jgi:hypothetical protein